MLTLATVQSDITSNVQQNGRQIRNAMLRAAQAGAALVQFAECALSGYADVHVKHWDGVDWSLLEDELEQIAALAGRLGVWVVLGSNHRLSRGRKQKGLWPQNSLYVISDQGMVVGRYAKRLCSNTELTYWYTPGVDPLVFEVGGVRFGCALCIEVVFPHLFTEYEQLGAMCVLLSCYSCDPIHGVMARAHAATNGYWVSMATPVACSTGLPTAVFGPDGHEVAVCPANEQAMLIQTLDPAADRYRTALQYARPWRAHARSGELHAARARRA